MATPAPSTTPAASSAVGDFTPEAFAAHLKTQAGAPAWWLERKRRAYARFAELPLPRRTDEAWRFSNIAGVRLDGFVGERAVPKVTQPMQHESPGAEFGGSLFFMANQHGGGVPVGAEAAKRGVIVCTLQEALRRHADLLQAHFMAQPQRLGSEKFAALHEAFLADGAFIYVPRGVELEEPIHVNHLGAPFPGVTFPHTLVIAEENSRVRVAEFFKSPGKPLVPAHFVIGANDLYAGHGAQLSYDGIQDWGRETLSLQLNSTVVRRDARVQSFNLHLGGRQSRHESLSQLQAPGAFSEMLAVTVAQGEQEFDQRTLQVHQAPNTKSDLLYKNALLDKARTIFSGLIIVDPDAQKTDAYQSNRNLMLSDEAEANSLPGLEIQANDVRCTHGATTARIDAEQEFYLKARGIPTALANQLLVFGFFEEVLERLPEEKQREGLRKLIQRKLQK
ncbi:MAG TPA: Fe-S cluster assembly protein SufD [Opitutaceae bacterium]|nr:Fe-S cluster assembly protein SufD [Opitutaceae bacterium]